MLQPEQGVGPLLTAYCIGAPAGIRTPNQQIMRRFEGHQQGETKRDEAVFTESAAVKVSYIWSRLSTPSRHNRAILGKLAPPNPQLGAQVRSFVCEPIGESQFSGVK